MTTCYVIVVLKKKQRPNNMPSADPAIMTVTCKMIEAFYTIQHPFPVFIHLQLIECKCIMGIDAIIAIGTN